MRPWRSIVILLLIAVSSMTAYGEGKGMSDRLQGEEHLYFAKKTNGEAWKLLEKTILTREEEDLLLYTVFSSAYHWLHAGTGVNQQRAEWLISRAYTKLNNAGAALFHAKKCLELTNRENTELKDFDTAYAYEAMARAYALNNDFENASLYYQYAKLASEKIEGKEDKSIFLGDLVSGNWNGFLPMDRKDR
jgi:hypothetical protein